MKKAVAGQQGFTLIEMMVACVVLTIGIVGLMALFAVAAIQNTSQGDQSTRTTEYATDKMEQLMALQYGDATSDTTAVPACMPPISNSCTGTGLGGVMVASASVGGLNTASPTAGYVDYVTRDGTPTTSSTNAAYIRQWQIATDSNTPPQIKTITVKVTALTKVGKSSIPSTTLVCQKANY
jgi:type IV pilus assembly protein PilV